MTHAVLTDRRIAHLLGSLSDQEHYVLLDTSMADARNCRSLLFTRPVAQLPFYEGDDRSAYLDAVEGRLQDGYWIAGWLGYEFFHDEIGIPVKHAGPQPALLADLAVYSSPECFAHDEQGPAPPIALYGEPEAPDYRISDLRPEMEEGPYCDAIRAVLDYIAAGDTYQVNYTFKLKFDFSGSVHRFYRDLRRNQPVPYGACIRNGSRHTLSLSPELFFRMERGTIHARPMKGTMKRGRTGSEDDTIARTLRSDVKNRSENVMIVDLLRNDLSRLVEDNGGGTVKVSSLFDIERYRTVFQMTSSIVARRFDNERVTPRQILDAIFPCGSVTGAPKIRTMEIIDELEIEPRGVYTGAIGFFSPHGEAVFNVPIRTVVIDGEQAEMGIGSGIVADSSPEDEWRECLLKAKFLTNLMPRYELIETMLHHPQEGFVFLADHLTRLAESAAYLGIRCDTERIRSEIEELGKTLGKDTCRRVRMMLNLDGETNFEHRECAMPQALHLLDAVGLEAELPLIDFAPEPVDSSSPWLYHKTTRRELYNRAYRQAVADGLIDVIFCNERDEITEGAISNVIAKVDGQYCTPPVESGLLPGVMRANLLREDARIPVSERVLSGEDLRSAEEIFICNAVRGVVRVKLREQERDFL